MQQEGVMADDLRRDDRTGREHGYEGGEEPIMGSPPGTDPQDPEALPGDPREAQNPQEPRSTHVEPGRDEPERQEAATREPEPGEDRGVIDQLKDAWDRMRGRD
jgi:hypothetical protein